MVELTIWEGELPGILMSAEAEVDAETRLMSIGTSPWTKTPQHTHTFYNSIEAQRWLRYLFVVWGDRNEHTGEINSDVQNHQQELMRPPSLTQALVWILGSSGTSQRRLLLWGSGAFNVHPFDNLWATGKLLGLEQSASRQVPAFSLPASLETAEIVLLLCSETFFCVCVCLCACLCVVCRRSSELHSLQTQSKAWLKSNFCLHNSCYLQSKFSLQSLFHLMSPFDSFSI